MKKLQIEATIPNLSQVISMTDELLEANECPVRTQTAIDIAVEEIFVNIANYAYERAIGGLGIYMVKNTMDSVHYERVNNSNIFTMTKELVDSDQ